MAKKAPKSISKLEKLMYKALGVIVLLLIVGTVFGQACLSQVNLEVEKLKIEVTKQENTNQSLVMIVNEMASLKNIQTVAENMGLAYNNNNIKTITE